MRVPFFIYTEAVRNLNVTHSSGEKKLENPNFHFYKDERERLLASQLHYISMWFKSVKGSHSYSLASSEAETDSRNFLRLDLEMAQWKKHFSLQE